MCRFVHCSLNVPWCGGWYMQVKVCGFTPPPAGKYVKFTRVTLEERKKELYDGQHPFLAVATSPGGGQPP